MNYVCDRCGADKGKCRHAFEEYYVVQPEESYRKEMRMYCWTLIGVGVVLSVLLAVILR